MPAQLNPGPALNKDLTVRAAQMDDLQEVVDLLNAYWEPLLGMRKVTEDQIRSQVTMPGFDMEASTRIVESPEGQPVGCITVWDLSSPPVHPSVLGCVHPAFERQGIGTFLLTWAEQRARQAIDRVPDGARVAMQLQTSVTHEPTKRLFERLGMAAIRYAWFMVTNLDERPPEPIWPENIVVRTYQDHSDLRAIYRAVDDAFRDQWGYVQRPEDEGIARFRHRIETDKDFDPSLWFLAMDGGEIAAVALCDPKTGDDSEMGWVNILGVRRPWRRKGLALALLHHSFGEFSRRGKARVGLGVDAESLTGATRLYKKAGMHVVRQLVTYEKELRPGKELGTQSVES